MACNTRAPFERPAVLAEPFLSLVGPLHSLAGSFQSLVGPYLVAFNYRIATVSSQIAIAQVDQLIAIDLPVCFQTKLSSLLVQSQFGCSQSLSPISKPPYLGLLPRDGSSKWADCTQREPVRLFVFFGALAFPKHQNRGTRQIEAKL